jgi:glutamyl-tRNA synthetase
VDRFDLDRIGKSNSKFDRDKLFRFDGDDIAAMEPADFARRWRAHCEAFAPAYLALAEDDFLKLAEAYRPRSRTLDEPCRLARFFIAPDDEIVYDPKAVKKWLDKGEGAGWQVLEKLEQGLSSLDDWSVAGIDTFVAAFAEAESLGMGKVAQPLRVAVSGAAVSPGIGETLSIVGKDKVLSRIGRCRASRAPSAGS